MSDLRRGFGLELTEEDLALERKLMSDGEKEALLKALGAWLDKQTHFRVPGPETGFHLQILRAVAFDLERAKILAENYARYRVEMPNISTWTRNQPMEMSIISLVIVLAESQNVRLLNVSFSVT